MTTLYPDENKLFSGIHVNLFEKNLIQTNILNESVINDSIWENEDNTKFLEKRNNITVNNRFETNNVFPFQEDKILEPTFPFIFNDISDRIPEQSFAKLFSTNSISKSNYKQNTDLNLNVPMKKKRKVFKIIKDNKSKGRIKKNTLYVGKHNKFSEDNIIRKIKGRFHEKCRIFINKEYQKYLLNNKPGTNSTNVLLQKIEPKLSKVIKRDEILKWLNIKLYQVFSENVSIKFLLYKPDYNRKQIQNLYKEKEAKNVINILNKSVKEMYCAFILNKTIPGFCTLDDDVKELREKMKRENDENIENYLIKYKKTALNLEYSFINKYSRNKKK